jgi:hypothetical protein
MKFKKGNKASSGRIKGQPNKSTKELRDALTLILSNNIDTIQEKLNEVAKNNPAKYIEMLLKVAEYSLPKLTSTQDINILPPQTYNISFDED